MASTTAPRGFHPSPLALDSKVLLTGGFDGRLWDVAVAAGSTISTYIKSTVTLGSGVYLNPLTITSTGGIDARFAAQGATGLYVPANITDASILNQGFIDGGYQGIGVDLAGSGMLTNNGWIAGGFGGDGYGAGGAGVVLGTGATLINSGTVFGGTGGQFYDGGGNGGVGVDIGSGAALINRGVITGGAAGGGHHYYGSGGSAIKLEPGGTAVNYGSIAGALSSAGADLSQGGSLTNDGIITGGKNQHVLTLTYLGGDGVILGFGATLTNNGIITGGYGAYTVGANYRSGGRGVELSSGATLINTGSIAGSYGGGNGGVGGDGIYLYGGTVITSGTISGGAGGIGAIANGAPGAAMRFGTAAGTLIIDPGAVFNGQVIAYAGAADVLDLAGTGAGTLSGLGTSFTNFASVVVDASAKWSLAGSNSLASGATVSLGSAGFLTVRGSLLAGPVLTLAGSGTLTPGKGGVIEVGTAGGAATGHITVDPGATLIGTGRLASLVTDNGTVEAHGGTLALAAAVSGQGTVAIDSGATLLAGAALKPATISFLAGSSESLLLRHPTSVTGTVSGFNVAGARDRIDLVNFTATGSAFSGHTLTVTGAGGVATLRFAGNYTLGNFVLSSDHTGGTNIRFA